MKNCIEHVAGQRLHHGIKTSLVAKLVVAKVALAWHRPAIACRALQDFIRETQAQRGKKLTREQADEFVTEATRIRTVIGCN